MDIATSALHTLPFHVVTAIHVSAPDTSCATFTPEMLHFWTCAMPGMFDVVLQWSASAAQAASSTHAAEASVLLIVTSWLCEMLCTQWEQEKFMHSISHACKPCAWTGALHTMIKTSELHLLTGAKKHRQCSTWTHTLFDTSSTLIWRARSS